MTGSIASRQKADGVVTQITKLEIRKLQKSPVLEGLFDCNRFPVQGKTVGFMKFKIDL